VHIPSPANTELIVGASGKADKLAIKLFDTGEKPFACDYCDKKFASGSNLKQHL